MPRQNTTERDTEYERLKLFVLAFADFLDADAIADPRPGWSGSVGPDGELLWTEHRGPPLARGPTLRASIKALEQKRPRGWRAAMRVAVQDLLETSRDLGQRKKQMADAYLEAQGAPTLTTMQSEIWRTIPKIMERGRINTESEYYLLVERLNDVSNSELSPADRAQLAQMVHEFEERRTKP